ncbi:MAG TPA: histidine phosphatase family protein [Ktedonobacteraceae bacterium]|nr:histidine phosphatase family protein [Ktedonobacteraceae bacterium]
MRLILVRHGETLYNAQKRFTGQSDVLLSPLGRRQIAVLGKYLAAERLDAIGASDLVRTRVTAEAIARYHTLPVRADPNLRELSLGEWEGHTYADVLGRDTELVAQWQANPTSCAPPGGETVAQLRDRIARAIRSWQSHYPEASILWVTHGGLIGVLLCHILGIELNRRWQFRHDNASISEIQLNGERATIVRLNETAHLRAMAMEAETVAEGSQTPQEEDTMV